MSSIPTSIAPAKAQLRRTSLIRLASLEFVRLEYGLNDRAAGRTKSLVALELGRVEEQNGAVVALDRAEQRARGYLPVAGHEHCPRCWVMAGTKSLLRFSALNHDAVHELARCGNCGAEYVIPPF